MIKITSIEIDGFIVPSQKVKLDFVESNIVCIYGNNGSGKTTFLEILFAVFDRDEKILSGHNVSKIKIEYISDNIQIKKQINDLKDELKKLEDEEIQQSIKNQIMDLEGQINHIENVFIEIDEDENGNSFYNFDSLDGSKFSHVSSLFLGIGRGIHKKELNIPRNMVWHFFNTNKKINEDKVLTGNEIDSFSDKLLEYLIPKGKSNINRVAENEIEEIDDKKNIYLPSIEIDTLEALLNSKYKDAVTNAKNKIEKVLSKTSLNFLNPQSHIEKNIDLNELRDKLIYNKSLLLEMFTDNENMGIETILSAIEKNENFLEQITASQQKILDNIVKELQSEVELFKEIQVFVDEYNGFLNYDKNLVINANGVFIAPENHSIQKLSSGERHLLTFLATILLMGEEQDFILLDEPEISLDIEWQEKLLSTIAKLVPNAQIIVASHSPSIMGDYFEESVEISICNE